ncbi:MAG TPA: YggS family pyridoxal phosphate-dependent enzyme [Chitinophagaceae bacterium]|nr:YggS family pyridoxal phosphate-dependent enzyme [Chitinophagaceae bacterium]
MEDHLQQVLGEIRDAPARLVAVSKNRSTRQILDLYGQGQRDFGENYVQELCQKKDNLPGDIRWHFIGHLQTNKVRQIASFVHTIHSIDSLKLLVELQRQAEKAGREINGLLQVHIACEETKTGMNDMELFQLAEEISAHTAHFSPISLTGLMGMASNTENPELVRKEFRHLRELLHTLQRTSLVHLANFRELSMGMSADYRIALLEGATILRIGSLLFGTGQLGIT